MNRYETVFIMTPVLSEEQAAETVEKFKKFLKSKGAKIKHEENWGLKKLAYPIQKKTTGFYQLFEFEATGDVITPFETEFRRDERILRFLTTSMDKFHIQYAESRRNKSKEKKEKSSETKAEA
jgi:small subunit ribosomal protein S6